MYELALLHVLERELLADDEYLAVDDEHIAAAFVANREVVAEREQPLLHHVAHRSSSPWPADRFPADCSRQTRYAAGPAREVLHEGQPLGCRKAHFSPRNALPPRENQ
jgi:hypothetical protein